MLVGVTQRLPTELDPRVCEKLPTRAADPDANHRPLYPATLEHSRKCKRPDEALRAKYSKSRRADDGEGQPTRLGEPRGVGWTSLRRRLGQCADRP